MGVVFGLVPVTNPVPTLVVKALIALKGRNALIISCQRRALSVGSRALGLIQEVLREHGAPEGLVQGLARRVGRKTTQELMQHEGVDFILATGGPGMVRAAHSSGTPAIGVGPGNAPAWICPGADLDRAARSVIASKSFAHGIICAAESNLVVDERVLPAFLDALELHGAAVLTSDEAARLRDLALHPSRGSLRLSVLGRSAESIALSAGIHREHPIRVLVLPLGRDQLRSTWAAEKLAPILSLFRVEGEDDGLVVCKELLDHYGKGHTAVIHSPDRALATRFACQVPASRVLVNVPAVQGTLGLCTDLVPSMTLGCGTMGGSSTTDSVGFRNLLNIKRLAFPSPSP